MLVVTRSEGQRILVGENIWITVVRAGVNVRIGIEAPPDVKILREEHVDEGKFGFRKFLTRWRHSRPRPASKPESVSPAS